MDKSFRASDNKRLSLGQFGSLGDLYNARSDNVLPRSIMNPNTPLTDCVRVLQTPKLRYNYTTEDTLEGKLGNLDISAELSASVLCGFVKGGLSANYVMKKRTNSHIRQASACCTMQTQIESLQLGNLETQHLNLSSLRDPDATHIICGVEWGAQTVVIAKTTEIIRTESHYVGKKPPPYVEKNAATAESNEVLEKDIDGKGEGKPELSHSPDKAPSMLEIKTKDDDMLGQMVKQISKFRVVADLQSDRKQDLNATEVEFEIMTDIADHSAGSLPTNQEGVLKFLQTIPLNLKNVNGGKGVPLVFHLMPIHDVAKTFGLLIETDIVLNRLNQSQIDEMVKTLDQLSQMTQECNEYENFVRTHLFCIPKAHHRLALQHSRAAKAMEEDLKEKFTQAICDIRSQNGDIGQLGDIIEEYDNDRPDDCTHLEIINAYKEKARFADNAKERGAEYLKFGDEVLQNTIASRIYEDVYVLYFTEDTRHLPAWTENWSKLFELLADTAPQECVIIVDCDVGAYKQTKELKKPFIEQWRDGKLIVKDFVEDLKALSDECLVKCDDPTKADRSRAKAPPSSKATVRLRCPGVNCFESQRKHNWMCPRCRSLVSYGFEENNFHCKCSRYPFSSAVFKCRNSIHGREWTKPTATHLHDQLKALETSREYNILLLGATGVGKSTFINAFCNYLRYDSLSDALSDPGPISYAIPSYFDVEEEMRAARPQENTTSNGDSSQFSFSVGNQSASEHFSRNGQSSTRESKIYSFKIGDLVLRLIDTPGIGDTEGRYRDQQNIHNILETLESVDKLSGILFLLPPNQPRATPAFTYYMTELIRHLHVDASKNILFGFTHSAPYFQIGSTKAPLDKILADLKLGGIRNVDTQFFFDSGPYNYIAKSKKFPSISFPYRQSYENMWKRSTDEVHRLVARVEDLPVHEVRKTLCLNRTRRVLEALPKPLTEFATSMKASQNGVEDFQARLAKLDTEDGDLAQKLSELAIPITYLEREDLPKRRVVCGHPDCDGETACHDDCDIEAQDGQKRLKAMEGCRAFRKALVFHFGTCERCNHPPSEHMMLSYRMIQKTRPLNQEEISKCQKERGIKGDAKSCLQLERETAARLLARIQEEKLQISTTQVLIGTYLGAFAIAASEDVLIKYLNTQISIAEDKFAISEADELNEQRSQYKAGMVKLQEAIKKGEADALNEKDVDDAMERLKKMDIFGPLLSKSLGVDKIILADSSMVSISCREPATSTGNGLLRKLYRMF
jgi:hypothetical protein